MRRLFQVANPKIVSEHNSPAVIILFSGYDIQQGRFPRTILGYQSDLLPLRDSESDIFE